jgi:hypothetical protein
MKHNYEPSAEAIMAIDSVLNLIKKEIGQEFPWGDKDGGFRADFLTNNQGFRLQITWINEDDWTDFEICNAVNAKICRIKDK